MSFQKPAVAKLGPLDSNDWKTFLAVGTTPFSSCNSFSGPSTCAGVFLEYKDKNDTLWYTAINNNYAQQNSNFTITKSKYYYAPSPQIGIGSNERVKFKGTFNCILYSASGNTLAVTNGNFVQRLRWSN